MQDSSLHRTYTSSTVVVVGLGKIGLPLAVQYAQHGCRVIGCDNNPTVIETVNAGRSPVQEVADTTVAALVEEGSLTSTGDTVAAVREADVVVVIVPVVVDERHNVSFDGIDATTEAIGEGLRRGGGGGVMNHARTGDGRKDGTHLVGEGDREGLPVPQTGFPYILGRPIVIYETTLPVGTTAVRFRGILERASQLQAGRDFYLAYSPERVSSGSIFRDLSVYPKIVGGIDRESTDAAVAFYSSVLEAEIMPMASTEDAEFVKLIETTYRDVNIALANEFACYADAHGLDVVAAIAAANTQPYSHIHTPGVGVGGHCIPVYPYFLLAGVGKSESGRNELWPLLPELPMLMLPRSARRINDAMAEYAVSRMEAIIGSLERQSVLILGVAYRGDVRESAFTSARLLQDALREHGAKVYVDDPLYSENELRAMGFAPLPPEHEEEIRAMVLQAGHQVYQEYDFSRFPHCQMVLDGRRALRREQIEALGMRYIAIGDGYREKAEGRDSSRPYGMLPVGMASGEKWKGGGA